MIPKIIHQSWKDTSIPPIYRPEWIQSWKDAFPDWQYRLWTDKDNADLISMHVNFLPVYNQYDYPIKRADAARYFYLYYYGGLYVDLDFICLRNFDALLSSAEVLIGDLGSYPRYNDSRYPNALMASAPFHPFWKYVIDCLIKQGPKIGQSANNTTGPKFLSKCIFTYTNYMTKMHGLTIAEPAAFYPIDWRQYPDKAYDAHRVVCTPSRDAIMEQFKSSFAVTYWTHYYKG